MILHSACVALFPKDNLVLLTRLPAGIARMHFGPIFPSRSASSLS